jgi:hypothetical protein
VVQGKGYVGYDAPPPRPRGALILEAGIAVHDGEGCLTPPSLGHSRNLWNQLHHDGASSSGTANHANSRQQSRTRRSTPSSSTRPLPTSCTRTSSLTVSSPLPPSSTGSRSTAPWPAHASRTLRRRDRSSPLSRTAR